MSGKTRFLTFVFLLTYFASYAAGQPVTVSIQTDLTTASGTFGEKVPVNVTDLTDLGVLSTSLIVSYDTNVLTATGVTVTDTIAEGSMVTHDVDEENGTISVAISRPNSFSGSGTLVFIFFDVDSDNIDDSTLELSQVKLNSGAIPATTSDGLIAIVDPPPLGAVTLSIQKDIIAPPGVTGVQVPVNVTDVTGLGIISANLSISYDTSILTATGATVLGTIAQDADVEVDIDDAKGQIALGLMIGEPLIGGGVLVFIVFDVDSDDPSEHSEIIFQKAHLNGGKVTTRTASGEVALPVTLSSFVAMAGLSGDEVILKWRVESETGNIGFAIYRSEQRDGPYTKIGYANSEGDTSSLRQYSFIDETIERKKVYFYMLESISLTGDTERSDQIKFDWSVKCQTTTTWGKLKL